jgi:hypothetical protein
MMKRLSVLSAAFLESSLGPKYAARAADRIYACVNNIGVGQTGGPRYDLQYNETLVVWNAVELQDLIGPAGPPGPTGPIGPAEPQKPQGPAGPAGPQCPLA